jgi:hypothetical protein
MQAHVGNAVCSETIVIRSNDEWRSFVSTLAFDGERYERVVSVDAERRMQLADSDPGLFALRGASS